MTDLSVFSDQAILAKTAWGENRAGGNDGLQSVLNVIINRANHPTWWGDNPRDVCLKPMQFDCWNSNDPNYPKLLAVDDSDPQYYMALQLAEEALAGTLPDLTNGSTYYYATSMLSPPYWAEGLQPAAIICGQNFYNNVA